MTCSVSHASGSAKRYRLGQSIIPTHALAGLTIGIGGWVNGRLPGISDFEDEISLTKLVLDVGPEVNSGIV